MRIHFQELTRAKKAAKALAASQPGLKLSAAQEGLARITGHRDWHHLTQKCHRTEATTHGQPLGDNLTTSQVIFITLRISETLDLGFGDALYALAKMRLPGIDLKESHEYEALWLRLLGETQPFKKEKHSPGTVVRIRSDSPGWDGVEAILKTYDSAVKLITHQSPDSCVADFEVVFPRKPLPLFIPARLKLAYGSWTEPSGSKVLFSRDYKPLWRLTECRKPARVPPWLWITYTDQQLFWDDTNPPWYSARRRKQEEHRLLGYGIVELPKLVEVLPHLVFDTSIRSIYEAVDVAARREDPKVVRMPHGWMRI